jgi:plasmid stabilization system protein ParE
LKQARFTQPARFELLGQTAYYAAIDKSLGARFRAEVEAAAQRAAAYPLHGKPTAGGTRRRLVAGFPFSVVYTEEDYGVLIHAVADSRRAPAYWLNRLP